VEKQQAWLDRSMGREDDVFTYNIIDRVYLNGELVEEDIKTVPVNDGDNIELETHWRD